jgi:hypothetical protein
MNEEITPDPENGKTGDTSKVWGVSLRGWISLIVILTICLMSGLQIDIKEPLYTLGGLIVGFYFGQNQKKQS